MFAILQTSVSWHINTENDVHHVVRITMTMLVTMIYVQKHIKVRIHQSRRLGDVYKRQGQWKSNRKPPMGYRLAPWPLTLNDLDRPSSGSLQLYSNISITVYGIQRTTLGRYTFHRTYFLLFRRHRIFSHAWAVGRELQSWISVVAYDGSKKGVHVQ